MTAKVTVLNVLGNGGLFSQTLPGYEERSQQIETALLIERGIRARRHSVVELGTGGGKSHAGLVPAVLSGERVVYSTAVKALQEQVADKDAPFLASVLEPALGRRIRTTVLKGRGNYVCLRNVDQLERDEAFRSPLAAAAFPKIAEWIGQQRKERDVADVERFPGVIPADLRLDLVTSTDECSGQRCRFYGDCFAERARQRAKEADVVIVNHKLLCMDARVREDSDGHAAVLPDHSLLILDEAHNIEGIIRDTAGVEVTAGRFTRLGWILQRLTTDHDAVASLKDEKAPERTLAQSLAEAQEEILHRLSVWFDETKARLQENDDAREIRLGDERAVRIGAAPLPGIDDVRPTIADVVRSLQAFSLRMREETPAWLKEEERETWAKLAEQTEAVANDIETIITPGQDATWVRRARLDGEDGKVKLVLDAKPVDVSGIGRRWFFGGTTKVRITKTDADGHETDVASIPPLTVVAMSATIATDGNTAMWRRRVGCDDAQELVSGSPFNYQQNALLYLPDSPEDLVPVQRNQPGYEDYLRNLSAEMRGLTLEAGGGAFLLFTSRSAMHAVYDRIADDLRSHGLLVLRQGDGSRAQMVAEFKADGNAVLFGLQTFGEGVDVQGDALRLVVVDKVPFKSHLDVLWAALCEDVKRHGGNDFRELSLPSAIIVLKQFVGRLIRTKRDRGVMAILDGRLRTKERVYGGQIVRNLPPARITSDPRMVRALYSQMREGAAPAEARRMLRRPVVRLGRSA